MYLFMSDLSGLDRLISSINSCGNALGGDMRSVDDLEKQLYLLFEVGVIDVVNG